MKKKRVFIFEYISSGGFNREEIPSSLFCEGFSMLRALVEDFKSLEFFYIDLLLDSRISDLCHILDPDEFDVVHKYDDCLSKFEERVKFCDYCFLVAPEFSNILYHFTEIVKNNKKIVLSCNLEAIRIGSSKVRTYNFFLNNNILTPKTYLIPREKNLLSIDFISQKFKELGEKIVIKPDDGVGAELIFYFDNWIQLEHFFQNELLSLDYNRKYVLQKYVSGSDLSVSLLILPNDQKHGTNDLYKLIILSINSQYINIKQTQKRSEYIGGHTLVEGYNRLKKKLQPILKNTDFSDFRGYIGIDFVKAKNDKFYFIEINPRLTTSYIGLRNIVKTNVMGLLIHPEEVDKFYDTEKLNATSMFSRLEFLSDGIKTTKEVEQEIIPKLVAEIPQIITPPLRFKSDQRSDPVRYSCFVATKTEDLNSSRKIMGQIVKKFEEFGLKTVK